MMNDDDDDDEEEEDNVKDDDGKNLINPVETLLIPPPTNTFSQSLFLANILLRKIAVFFASPQALCQLRVFSYNILFRF